MPTEGTPLTRKARPPLQDLVCRGPGLGANMRELRHVMRRTLLWLLHGLVVLDGLCINCGLHVTLLWLLRNLMVLYGLGRHVLVWGALLAHSQGCSIESRGHWLGLGLMTQETQRTLQQKGGRRGDPAGWGHYILRWSAGL